MLFCQKVLFLLFFCAASLRLVSVNEGVYFLSNSAEDCTSLEAEEGFDQKDFGATHTLGVLSQFDFKPGCTAILAQSSETFPHFYTVVHLSVRGPPTRWL